jgi:two-component sensor histidine kinase
LNLKPKMKFFPRERQFWLYHGAAMAFVTGVTLASFLLFGRLDAFNFASTLVWMPPYTLAVLGFRWQYLRRGWTGLRMGRLIPIVIAYSLGAGMAVMACVSAMLTPIFWPQLSGGQAGAQALYFLLRGTISNGLQAQLFISAWAFVYISAGAAARAREGELQNLRLQMSLKAAQLSQLAHQLKPHFLFNALNNIRFMIHEDGARAEAMIVALSEILRHSLEGSQRGTTTLHEELEVIQAYLSLMRSQLEERLDFRLQVAPGLQACLLPPMVLQLLVENAIKHGIEALPAGGILSLEVQENVREDGGSELLLRVGNARPRLTARHDKAGMGLGLPNIERRLQLLYGARASLMIEATEDFFQVELRLPKELDRK